MLGGDRSVLLAHRARDPGHVVVREQAAERRDEPAAAPPRDAVAVGSAPYDDRRAVGDDEKLYAGSLSNLTTVRRTGCSRFTKRSREPRAAGRECSSNSSAIVRMIAIPRPPSVSSSPSSGVGWSGSKPFPSSTTSTASASPLSSYAIETNPPSVRVRVPDRVRHRLGQRELEIGERARRATPRCRRSR